MRNKSEKINFIIKLGVVVFSLAITAMIVAYIEFDVEYLAVPLKYVFIVFGLLFFLLIVISKAEHIMECQDETVFDITSENSNSNLDEFIEEHQHRKNNGVKNHNTATKLFALNKVSIVLFVFLEILIITGYSFANKAFVTHYTENPKDYILTITIIFIMALILWFNRMSHVDENKIFEGSLYDYFNQSIKNIKRRKISNFSEFRKSYDKQKKSTLITLKANKFIKFTIIFFSIIIGTIYIRFGYFFE